MKLLIYIIFLALCFLRVSPLKAGSYGLPKTGQVEVYHEAGPNDLGDDGAIQAGYPLGSQRSLALKNNYDGTVTDYATGLMWQKSDSSAESFGGFSGQMTWDNAFWYVAAMNSSNYANHQDWRVPNIKELASILNLGTWGPSTYNLFDSTQSANYWSSTSLEIQEQQKTYFIAFNEAYIQYCSPDYTQLKYIKAVRSYLPGFGIYGFPMTGQGRISEQIFHPAYGYDLGDDGATRSGYPLVGDHYFEQSNGTVIQNSTGLVWQKEDSSTQSFGGYFDQLTWEDAFNYVAGMNAEAFGGYTDWRLPNYIELISLLDFGYFWPIINPSFEPIKSWYWSSSNRFGVTPANDAWTISWASGWGDCRSKLDTYYVRAVRGGPVVTPSPVPPQPSPTPYPVYGIPKTGQTTVIYQAGANNPGDDGATQIGYPLNGPRFTDNGNGTLTDNATGLMWQKSDSGTKLSWENAFTYVASLNSSRLGNFNDWRMPNIKELNSLVDLGSFLPAINKDFFTSVKTDAGYWGSTTYADLVNGQRCYQVLFSEGHTLWINMDDPGHEPAYVRGVRSINNEAGNWGFPKTGQTNVIHYPDGNDRGDDGAIQAGYPANPGGRFVDNGDGTVSDSATGLIWQKADSAFQTIGQYSGYLTWEEAFEYIREMNIRKVCGYSNWRLPNYHELASLFDYSRFAPAVDPIFQNSVQSALHWTSSSRKLSQSNWHWAINFPNGHGTFYDGSKEKAYVIAVMGGPGQIIGPQVTTPTPQFGPTPDWGPTPIPGPTALPVNHLYYGLSWTGQTSVYHPAGNNDMGDDGVTRIGYPSQRAIRWEATGYGTVIDWATGLMWQQNCSNGEYFEGLGGVMTWEDAFRYVALMNHANYGGYSDWRVPNCLELLSTRNLEESSTEPDIFIDTAFDPYWTSTCYSGSGPTLTYRMSYSFGHLLITGITDSILSGVRACRSFYNGESNIGFPKTGRTEIIHEAGWYDHGDDGANQAGFPRNGDRFTDNSDGTVTDNATGLIWQQGCSATGLNWNAAFEYIKSLNQQCFSGYSDWRLPNQMELFSIVDYGRAGPAINPIFTGTYLDFYWSSNTQGDKGQTTNAWAVNFVNGSGDIFVKAVNNYYVRAVRGNPVIPGLRPTPTPNYDRIIINSGDYDGNGAADIAIFRKSLGLWAIRDVTRIYFGGSADVPISGDYNGDGTSDIGIFRNNSGLWAIRGLTRIYYGSSGDMAIPGDYQGNGSCDIGIYRNRSGLWAIRGVTRVYFGGTDDVAVPGDYSGQGTADLAIFRAKSGLWAIRSISRIYFGDSRDMAIPGNYNTSPGWEVGIFRSTHGLWAIRNVTRTYFGSYTDQPVQGDYDANRLDDIGIFRANNGLWAIKGITRIYYGSDNDIPVTR